MPVVFQEPELNARIDVDEDAPRRVQIASDTDLIAAGDRISQARDSRDGDSSGTEDATGKANKAKRRLQKAQKAWLKVDSNGDVTTVFTERYKTAQRLGVQARDLRLLDPQLASLSPPAILDREKAIVVNLEFVKCIITMDYVMVVNPDDEKAAAFISELRNKLANPGAPGKVLPSEH